MNSHSQETNPSPFPTPGAAPGTTHLPALLGAAFAALVGAIVWGLIAWLTGYEVGYVAWGIGLLVGFAAVKLGGRGVATASTAAALTLVAIFVGKVLGTHFLIEKEFAEVRDEFFTAALYEELDHDAEAWNGMTAAPSDGEVRQFMVDHDYGGYAAADDVTREDLQYFRSFSVPVLEKFGREQPSFQQWQGDSFEEYRSEFEADLDLASIVVRDLNAFDLIFAFLAVSTAYGMISRRGTVQGDRDHGDPHPPYEHELRRAA